jgi:hypothetical protein
MFMFVLFIFSAFDQNDCVRMVQQEQLRECKWFLRTSENTSQIMFQYALVMYQYVENKQGEKWMLYGPLDIYIYT